MTFIIIVLSKLKFILFYFFVFFTISEYLTSRGKTKAMGFCTLRLTSHEFEGLTYFHLKLTKKNVRIRALKSVWQFLDSIISLG